MKYFEVQNQLQPYPNQWPKYFIQIFMTICQKPMETDTLNFELLDYYYK